MLIIYQAKENNEKDMQYSLPVAEDNHQKQKGKKKFNQAVIIQGFHLHKILFLIVPPPNLRICQLSELFLLYWLIIFIFTWIL